MDVEPALAEVLADAQRLGFLGARPIEDVIEHARSFVAALTGLPAGASVLDLGAGGGVPGLVIAHDRPDLRVTLLDRRTKRTDALERAVRRLRWTQTVSVLAADAVTVARSRSASFDAVVARGFGPPDETLAIAARLCVGGGRIVISEPPIGDRWDPAVLDAARVERVAAPHGVAVFTRRFT